MRDLLSALDWKYLLSLLASCGALFFSLLSYKRSRRLENENHLYKLKVEVYGKLLGELMKLLSGFNKIVYIAIDYLEHPGSDMINKLDNYADEVDTMSEAFETFVISNSLLIPENILAALDKFSEKVWKTDTLYEDNIEPKTISYMEKKIAELTEEADEISELLRSDLHIDKINFSLYRRLR